MRPSWIAACVVAAAIAATTLIANPASTTNLSIAAATAAEQASRTGNVHQLQVGPGRVTIIADSALTGIETYGQLGRLVGAQWDVRMQTCRRLVQPSCAYGRTSGPPTALQEIAAIAWSGGATGNDDVLVIATGHNDWEARFRGDLVAIMEMARRAGFEKVAWMLYRDHFDPTLPQVSRSLFERYGRMNAMLREEANSGRWPDLVLLEYGVFTRDHPEWFLFDGIHLTKEGAVHLADWLSSVIRYDRTPALRP